MSCTKDKERSRVPNFSNSEKVHLLRLISNKYANKVEDKKTDRASNSEKDKAWQLIEQEFNASSTNNVFRNAASLKKCYENRKKEIKKTLAEERKETMLTGGGPPPKRKRSDTDNILISILNNKTLVGLHNQFDDDADQSAVKVAETNNVIEYEFINDEDELLNNEQTEEIPLTQNTQEMNDPALRAVSVSNNVDWNKYTPVMLQSPISTSLLFKDSAPQPVKEGACAKEQETPKKNSSRRRPTTIIKPLTSSDIAKKYDILLDKRLQILDCQLKHIETTNKLVTKKLELEIEILKMEISKKKNEVK